MEQFKYSPLKQDEFRLIRILPESTPSDIRCTLQHQCLDPEGTVERVALSYCWGDPTPVATITLNDRSFGVARNLLEWLEAQCGREQPRLYWVDAICINQSDIPERNAQVQQMWRVYSEANYVLSWLGSADAEMTLAFAVLRRIEAKYGVLDERSLYQVSYRHEPKDLSDDEDHLSEEDLVAGTSLWDAEYFRRVWVMPELMNARGILLQSGELISSWTALVNLTKLAKPDHRSQFLIFERLNRSINPAYSNLTLVTCLRNTFKGYREKKCSDLRDKAFSLSAIPSVRKLDPLLRLKADYTMSIEEVCLMTITFCDQAQGGER